MNLKAYNFIKVLDRAKLGYFCKRFIYNSNLKINR